MPPPPSHDPAIATLVRWITSNGGFIGPVAVRSGSRGRGVFSTAAVKSGDILLSVPRDLCITGRIARCTVSGGILAAQWEGEAAESVTLAAAVEELRLTRDPEWAPYLATLPAQMENHPAQLSLADRGALRGTSAQSLLVDLDARHTSEWRWLRDHVPGFVKMTAAEWGKVRVLVTSRQFHLSDSGATGLVPFADLFNHSSEPAVRWTLDREKDAFVVRLCRDVEPGAELGLSYGAKSNLRMLLHYGFTLATNPDDEVIVDAPGIGCVVLPLNVDAAAEAVVTDALGVGELSPGRKRRAWRQFAEVLEARLQRLPVPAPEGHPIRVSVDRVVAGERAVLSRWISHAASLADGAA